MFRPIFITATDLDDAWFRLLWNLFEHGRKYFITKGSYEGQYRYSFDFVAGFISHPHTTNLAPIMPEGSSLYPPTTHEEIEQYFANYLMNSDLAENEDYKYGTWIVGGQYDIPRFSYSDCFGNIYPKNFDYVQLPNQIQWVISHFNEVGIGNAHCYITVGYPESNFAYDIPYNDESERRTSPCLRGLDFRVVDGHLLTNVIYRSWDLVEGFPTNMGGFALLNQYVAEHITVADVKPGPLTFACKDLHSYEFAYKYVAQRIGKGE
jgi:thymidylate synthase